MSHQNRIEEELSNWSGEVKLSNNLNTENVLKDNSIFVYKIISLVSGCIFETLYFQNFVNETSKTFDQCFCRKNRCMGQGDWYNFNHLISDFKNNLFGEKTNREFLDFLYSGFRIEYEKEVNALKDFIKELNKIVESQSEIVLNDYDSNRETTHYSFIIASNDLDVLSEEVYKIMEENDFVDVLDNATQRVMNKIVKQYL